MGIDRKQKTSEAATDLGGLTLPADFRAAAEAIEKDSDSAWALWQEANAKVEGGDPRYAKTEPAGLAGSKPAQLATPAFKENAKSVTVEEAMVVARKNNRVVPRPVRWHELFDMLPGKVPGQPPAPSTGKAWSTTTSIAKRSCLREQLDWAARRGVLDTVYEFLQSLPESDWLHMDE